MSRPMGTNSSEAQLRRITATEKQQMPTRWARYAGRVVAGDMIQHLLCVTSVTSTLHAVNQACYFWGGRMVHPVMNRA